MKYAVYIRKRAEALRMERVERNYAAQLAKLEDDIEDDINQQLPKGEVVTEIPYRVLEAAARDRRTPDLIWYLTERGYTTRRGQVDPCTQQVEIIVSWMG